MATPLRVGRYEALRPIASGGMATVYLGRSEGARGFERQVAIKAMHPHLAEDPEFVTMFLDEARMAANIRHPNVVPTLDVAEEDGKLFLVMEYIEGLSLQALTRAVRKKRVSVPLPVALRISLDVLAGLHAAHELRSSDGTPMNLVHRDVSPPNVIVGADGISRIMDFGIARAETRITSTQGSEIKGKVPYMSPEQIEGAVVDRRTDIYAAGIVTWEILAGEGLFRADNQGALVNMVILGASRPPSSINSAIPAALDTVCMRALARDAGARYATAAIFADALEAAAGAAGISIASPRAVSAFLESLSGAALRSVDGADVAAEVADPSSLEPSSLGSEAKMPPPEVPTASAARDESDRGLRQSRRGGRQSVIIAAVTASLVTAGGIWLISRGKASADPPAAAATPPPPATASAAPVQIAPPIATPAATPAVASAAPIAPVASQSAPPARKPPTESGSRPVKNPQVKPTATAFRPEEP